MVALGPFLGPVGQHDVGAGAADGGERLRDRRLAADPAVQGGVPTVDFYPAAAGPTVFDQNEFLF